MMLNTNAITIQDCIEMADRKEMYAVINDGQVLDFVQEKSASDVQSECAQ